MWCYEIENKVTGERNMVIGHNWEDAFKGTKLNPDEWFCLDSDYVD